MRDADRQNERLQQLLDRMWAGDDAARDELLWQVERRLKRLARRMLNDFPDVRRWDDTGDVMQNSLLRLLRSMEAVRPTTVRGFIALAAKQIRRELLDLVRHYRRPQHSAPAVDPHQAVEIPAPEDDTADMDRWCAFHEAIEKLPVEEREVIELVFYHAWTQERIATLFKVDERTVRRWWRSGCLRVKELLGGEMPTL